MASPWAVSQPRCSGRASTVKAARIRAAAVAQSAGPVGAAVGGGAGAGAAAEPRPDPTSWPPPAPPRHAAAAAIAIAAQRVAVARVIARVCGNPPSDASGRARHAPAGRTKTSVGSLAASPVDRDEERHERADVDRQALVVAEEVAAADLGQAEVERPGQGASVQVAPPSLEVAIHAVARKLVASAGSSARRSS